MPAYNDDYLPKTEPFTHQVTAFDLSKDELVFALFMEPRTGKTKVIIDTVARLYEHGKVIGLLIIAWPSGVHGNWITDEIPAHLPDHIRWKGFIWQARRWKLKHVQADFEGLLTFQGLRVLAINAEALGSAETRKVIGRFIVACGGPPKVFGVGDETLFMQSPKSLRAKAMAEIKKVVGWRRILDGTPISNMGPFGLYSQVGWLDSAILGHTTFTSFKAHYSQMEVQGDKAFTGTLDYMRAKLLEENPDMDDAKREQLAMMVASKKGNSWIGPAKDEQGRIRFRNMSELTERLEPISYRITFHEVFRDVPRPLFEKKYFSMSGEQERIYNTLRDEFKAELSSGTEIDGTMAMTRYLRLQQVTSNFIPPKKTAVMCPECEGAEDYVTNCLACEGIGMVVEETPMERISADNPRVEALDELIGKSPDQWLIWARFNQEIDDIIQLARDRGITIGRYDGQVSYEEKLKARNDFQAGKIQWFVGKQTSAGRGIPLWKAKGHVFLSNFWSLDARQQAEMRAEISHRRVASEMWDIVAKNTIDDTLILPALRNYKDVARLIMGDPKHDWL